MSMQPIYYTQENRNQWRHKQGHGVGT